MSDEAKKQQVGTSLEVPVVERIRAVALKESASDAHILRKCVLAGLPSIERQVLGAKFVGGKRARRKLA